MSFNEFARMVLITVTFGRALAVETVTVVIQSIQFYVITLKINELIQSSQVGVYFF